ncbi:MAG TPA: hypothetical protein ENK98_05710 [Epsilonproteobacteria bacterium]|nr:hypothetical protein [Campylobacterota bacterium]
MKKYLVAMVVLGSVSVNAGTNPFDLKENLQRIDKDQDVLLSALKNIADEQEVEEVDDAPANDAIENEAQPAVEQNVELEATTDTTPNTEINTSSVHEAEDVEQNIETSKVDVIREKLMAKEARKHQMLLEKSKMQEDAAQKIAEQKLLMQKQEEERIKKVQEEQAKIERERAKEAEAQAKKEAELMVAKAAEEKKLAAQKLEEEKREVAAYEAKRLAKKKAEEALLAEQKRAEEAKKQAMEQEKHAVVDINITREEIAAKKEADEAYLEAVKEMDSDN